MNQAATQTNSGILESGSSPSVAEWEKVEHLRGTVAVEIPVAGFTVGDFLELQPGSVVAAEWLESRKVPVRVNGELIGWGEFEESGGRLAVRVTEFA